MSIFFYAIIGLAVLGILTQLFKNPAMLFKSIFMIIGVGILISVVAYLLITKGLAKSNSKSNSEMKKYKQAVKQSQLKYKQSSTIDVLKTSKNVSPEKKNAIKRRSHLRVIEGKKTKNKDSVNF